MIPERSQGTGILIRIGSLYWRDLRISATAIPAVKIRAMTAHANTGTDSLQQCNQWVGNVDGR